MGDRGAGAFDEFDAIAEELSELRFGAAAEQRGEAHEIIAAGIATRAFIDELRRVSPGDVVTVVGADGVPVRGRILSVGADWLRLGEVADETGTRRSQLRRLHDFPLDAIVRVSRESVE